MYTQRPEEGQESTSPRLTVQSE